MARLIRTEKEVEGRFEEVWLVVEEDPLQQWPEGPLSVVGRPALRKDGLERVRGEARYTADIRLPGMLHTAVLRCPHGHARVRRIDLGPALALPGVRAAVGPGDVKGFELEAGYAGAPVAAVAADTFGQARAAVHADRGGVGAARGRRRSGRGGRSAACSWASRSATSAASSNARSRQPDVVVEGTYRTSVVLHNSMETHQSVCERVGETLNVYTSTQYVWGVRNALADEFGIPGDKVRVVCEYMGGGFGSKNDPGDYTFAAAELARRTGRPVRCALTRREENTAAGNRNATIQRLTAAARATARSSRWAASS